MKKEEKRCIECKKIIEGKGRQIDGRFEMDKKLPDSMIGKWVCDYLCYLVLIGKFEYSE